MSSEKMAQVGVTAGVKKVISAVCEHVKPAQAKGRPWVAKGRALGGKGAALGGGGGGVGVLPTTIGCLPALFVVGTTGTCGWSDCREIGRVQLY